MGRQKKQESICVGDIVFLRTDPDKFERLVTKFEVDGYSIVKYELSLGTTKSMHYEYEIVREIQNRNVIKGFKNNEGHINKPRRQTRASQGKSGTV